MKNKKKAFTLTELLVVVIVIGVLSAAVLPKFSKVIETRKTTEAEELMASIRTEQEKRCALDKPYLTDLSQMNDVIKTASTKNYQINLQNKGINAASKGNYSYTLQMPSYADGRICCDGADCEKLNKNYPSCTGFTYEPSPDSCAGTVTPVEPEIKSCSGSSTQTCGCQNKGTQSRTCNTTTGEWSDWGACSVSDACECTGTKDDRRACTAGDTCGFETRTATCDASTGEWKYGSWKASACAAKPTKTSQTCSSCGGQQSITYTCNKDSGAWESALGDCDKPEDECEQTCTGEEKRTDVGGPYEYKNPPTRADTCDGDKKTMFSCGNKPTVCYDVYSTVIGSMTIGGAVTCGGTQKNCAVGYQNACIDGAWRCIVRCPDGGCADGTLNPAEGGETTSGGGFRLVYFVDKVVCCDADQVKLGDLGKLEVVK